MKTRPKRSQPSTKKGGTNPVAKASHVRKAQKARKQTKAQAAKQAPMTAKEAAEVLRKKKHSPR